MTINVNKTAKDLNEGISNMMAGAKKDYKSFHTSMGKKEIVAGSYGDTQLKEYESKTRVDIGRKFIKVVQERSVFAFIVKEDGDKFKKGDILKPAGFNAPAQNAARGNVLTGNYYINWTGPCYMDSQRRLRA
tara:strand:+ start:554 stop:949 length:396 start_codon:yes stop_codon:yes gene_type:complete